MKPTIILALMAMLLSFSACKEEDNDEPLLINPSLLIKSATQYENGRVTSTTTYEYDNLGRVTKVSYNPNFYEQYNYMSDTMILVQKNNMVYNYETDTLLLDSRGLVVANYHQTTFEYNAEGYGVKSTSWTNPASFNTFEILNGNTVKMTMHQLDSDNSVFQMVVTHQYLANSINTIGNENVGKPFYGRQNKNLASKALLKRIFSDGDQEYNYTFSYQFDRYRRVTRQTQEGGSVTRTTDYTYND